VSVTVDTIPPIAAAGIDTLIDCYNNVITLDGGNSSLGDFSYFWSTIDGAIDLGEMTLQPTISTGGTYELLVTNNQSGCSSIDSVFVGENLIIPISSVGQDTIITCTNPIIFLSGNGSSVGADFEYQWMTTNGGNIFSNPTSLQPEINSAGNYQLSVTNITNGCTSMDEVIVVADTDLPTAEAGVNMTVDCNQSEVMLNGSGSVGMEFEYLWTATNGGNILSGGTTFTPTANGDGDYELLVTNTSSGCTQIDLVSVTVDTIPPIAAAGIDTLIDCYNNVITLDGGNSSLGDFSYLWSTTDGAIDLGEMTLQPTISTGGTYELLVTNNQSGCSSIDSVFVGENLIIPISSAGQDTIITCTNPIIFLSGNSSSVGANFEYQWMTTNGGNIFSNSTSLQPEIDSAGNYQLLVTNITNGCTSVDEVTVAADTNLPTANAGLADMINCNQLVINLDGSASSSGINLIYLWTTSDGSIVFGENTLTPQVDSAGNYLLTVTDTISGCTAESPVEIFIDTLPPNADAGSTMELNCLVQNIILDGTSSSTGNDISYQWTTNDGNIFSNQNSLQPTVNQSGTYYLEVTNNINNCIALDSVFITQNITTPISIAGVDTLITCENLTLFLDGSGSSLGLNYLYQWTAINGGIIDNNPTSLQPEISAAGNYELVVTDSTNGCTTSDFLIVDIDTNPPTADAGSPEVINCNQLILTLDGSLSSTGNIYDYEWVTVDGNIILGETTLSPQIDSAGTYILEVINTQNGCSNISTVTITADTILPMADAGIDTMITCESNVINLNGTNSSMGNFIYNWTTIGTGTIVNENTLTPEINDSGTYQIEVTNPQNGCISIAEVDVVFDTIAPIAEAGLDGFLDCDITSLTLGGNSSTGTNFEYQWTYPAGGNILTDSTQATITVNAGATYTLLVTNVLNSCTATDEAVILQDANLPIVITNLMDTILCDSTQLTLNGNGSSVGIDFSYNWATADGNIIANENTLFPIVDSVGLYTLTVVNAVNNCASTAFVNVVLEDCEPIAFAGADGQVDCNFPSTILDGTGSSVGAEIIYFWITSDGVILSGATTLLPTVGASGTYVLTVENTLYGLTATDTVLVENLVVLPSVDLSVNTLLSCVDTIVLVDGNNSSMGTNFLYSWSTNDGNVVAVIGADSISVDQSGFYFLEITNTTNGCVTIDSIEVLQDINLPIANTGVDIELNCYNNVFTLDGSGSSVGNNFIYSWTTSAGNIVSGDSTLSPLVESIGTYILEVTDTTNGCFAQSSVMVTGNFTAPIVDAGITDVLTCIDSILTLDGTASSQGGNFIYEWTTVDGNILNGENSLTPQVDSAGNYQLVVFDSLNGCADSSAVFINANFIAPTANAGMDAMIDCGVGSLFLDGNGSSLGAQFFYSWTTPNGNILANVNTLFPEITISGNYFLTVENTTNGCTAIDEVMIDSVNCMPMVMIDLPDTLTCLVTQIMLDGSASSNWGTIKYEWTTGDGNIVGVNNLPVVEVNLPGTYQLILTDTLTNKIAFGSVVVEINNTNPIADAGITDTLNCLIASLNLNGSASTVGSSFSYEWTTGNGNIVSGSDEIQPLIDEVGTYNLQVTNNQNGCIASSSVLIEIDTLLPTVDVGFSVGFTCVDTMLFLNGLGSSMGNNFVYEWTTDDGNIVGDFTILSPQIDEAGTYELTILNTQNYCEASNQILIEIDTVAPTILIEPAGVLDCDLSEFELDATASSTGNNLTTQWQTSNGNIVNGVNSLSPQINDGGDYELTILNTQNGCSSSETITVSQDTIVPVSAPGMTMELTCVDTFLTLDGSGSSSGINFSYEWQTLNGNIESGGNSLFPNINLAGDYELIVIDNNNMCTSTNEVQVLQDVNIPVAMIDLPDTLNCEIGNTILSAISSSNGLIYSYLWSTSNGNINFGETSLNPQVSEGGGYDLIVTNDENGCTATDFIEVMQDTIVPISAAGATMTLTCVDTVLTLSGNGSSVGNEFNYEWTTDVGNLVNGVNSLNPQVDGLGIYQLEITNHNNMCTSADFVEILENITPPEVEINAIGGLILNCNVSSIVLDGSSSLPNGNVSFEWSSANGNILAGNTDPNPEVDLEGDYLLVLTNEINGCTAAEMVQITGDFELPIVQILEPDTLTCLDTLVIISGSGSSTGSEFEYLWTHTLGNIVSGETTLACTVDEFGGYVLTVLNTENGCMVAAAVTVYQNAEEPFADAGGNYEFDCIQTVGTLQGDASQGAAFTYLWTTDDGNITVGSTSLQPIVDAFGTYILTVTNQINGCTATSEATVTQDLDVPQEVELEIISPLCFGDYNGSIEVMEVIGGEAPYFYSLDGNTFTEYPLFSNLPTGNYLIIIQDASGCEWNSTVEIIAPAEVMVDLGEDLFLELGESTVLQAITNISTFDLDSVSWMNIDSLECEDCLEQEITPLFTSGYGVFLMNDNGCVTEDEVIVYVNNKRRIFIPNAFSPNGDGQNDLFMIYGGLGVEEIENFQIFSRWGDLVFEKNYFQSNDPTMGWDGFFKGKKMNPAVFVFFAKIRYANGETEIVKGDLFLK
jgi:gliding motility-associated-like protein